MTAGEARLRLLELLEGRSLTAVVVEADPELLANQEVVLAAAHSLAREPDIVTAEKTDGRTWFPFSSMIRKGDG